MLLYQFISTKYLPFFKIVPNEETVKAMKKTNNGEGLEKTDLKGLASEWEL